MPPMYPRSAKKNTPPPVVPGPKGAGATSVLKRGGPSPGPKGGQGGDILTGAGGTVPALQGSEGVKQVSPAPAGPRGHLPSHLGASAQGGKTGTQGPAASSTPANQELDDLAQLREDQKRERDAQQAESARAREQALADASARAGLGGFGLSGGTSALLGDIQRTQTRSAELAQAELGRKQRDEQFQAEQRQIALDDLEAAEDRDIDGDGMVAGEKVGGKIGDRDPENNPAGSPEETGKRATEIVAGTGGTGKDNDPYGGIGGMSEAKLKDLIGAGLKFDNARVEYGLFNGEIYVYAKGSDGNYYKFKVPEDATKDQGPYAWFKDLTGTTPEAQ